MYRKYQKENCKRLNKSFYDYEGIAEHYIPMTRVFYEEITNRLNAPVVKGERKLLRASTKKT